MDLDMRALTEKEDKYTFSNSMEDLDEPLTDGLVRSSEKIYDALLLGKSYPETVGEGKTLSFDLKYIDWEHPENNLFHVTEEFAVDSRDKLHNARPDIVLFINGTRTPMEYSMGHVKGFINIPVDELRERIGELDMSKPVYVICQSGLRSYIASRILMGNGFDAYNFAGGFRFYDAVRNDKALNKKSTPCGMDD